MSRASLASVDERWNRKRLVPCSNWRASGQLVFRETGRKMEFGHEVISDGYACIFIYPPPVTDPRTICANREAGLANKPNGRRPFPQDRRMIVSRPFWYIHDRLEYRPMLLPPAFIISNPLEPSVNRDREVDCAVAIDLVSSCFGFSGNGNLRGS